MPPLKHHQNRQHDDSGWTKVWCICGLIVGWIAGIVTIAAGSFSLYREHRDGGATQILMSHTWRELLPLGLNIAVTLLNDCMGYIHTCSLRWSLHEEGKLDFNSNLRLLTAAKNSRPNRAVPNALYLTGIVFSYGSTSLIFLSLNPELARVLGKAYDRADADGVHANGVALLFLGVGFLLQAAITTWALMETNIPTWSSNPLTVARACLDENDGHRLEPRIGRCMMGVHLHDQPQAKALKPRPSQRPMISAHHHVVRILMLLWSLPILGSIWGGGVYAYLLRGSRNGVYGRSWSLLPIFTGTTDTNCSTRQCTDGTSVLNMGWSAKGPAGTVGGVFVITIIQSIVTLALHCAELIVNLARDEKVFRELIGPRGTNPRYSSILAAFTSWQTLFLFALKAGVHWMFGLAINMQFQLGVNMHPPQIFYFAALSLIAAILGLALSMWRPSGKLPPSYGHLQTIVDIIDDWGDSGCMFWGEKYKGNAREPGYTGTNTRRLEQPDERLWYGGQRDAAHMAHRASPRTEFSGRFHTGTPFSSYSPNVQARISLISRSDIRYSGTLHSINSDDSTVSLENVRSFGTEDRKTNPDEFVPPSDQVYEYIVFRGTDVKDLRIEEGPAPVKEEKPPAMPNDPAILGARPRNVPTGPSAPQGPQGLQSPAGPQNQQGPPPGAPGFGYFPPHMAGWGRAAGPGPGPGPGPFGGMPYPPPGWFPPGQEFPPMGHGPWNPYPFQPGPGGLQGAPGGPGAPGTPSAPGQGRQSANQTPSNQGSTQKPAPIGPAADRKPISPAAPAGPSSQPNAPPQAPRQPAAAAPPAGPAESKPKTEEGKAPTASLDNKSLPTQTPTTIPTGPKSSRPTQILPAVPLPAALTAKVAQTQAPKPAAEQGGHAAAAAALRDATQAAKEAVAAAMAQLNQTTGTSATQTEANGMDNLAKRVDEMRINAARAGHHGHPHRGGRGRGPRPQKVEIPDTDFDFESANAKFNKQDVVKEAVMGEPLHETAGENGVPETAVDAPAPVEPAYNKSKSFFDNISSESKDRENAGQRPGGAHWRGEETRKNIETFGQGSVDGGYRNYRGRGRGRGGRGRGYRGGRGGGGGGYRGPRDNTQPAAATASQ
ncbi:hypothetical protein VTJ49DRAFT_7620 [Mycothermus thermophilus]|uniref:Uncharacterized protein n=1 Tax=Humicola insolens TaxID=85995 RepID=A0ABR3VGU9_HUMIN